VAKANKAKSQLIEEKRLLTGGSVLMMIYTRPVFEHDKRYEHQMMGACLGTNYTATKESERQQRRKSGIGGGMKEGLVKPRENVVT